MANTITIGPGEKLEPGQVAIWERDALHPDGEIYLADGDEPIEAARTAAVQARIADGRLVETEARPKAQRAATAPAPALVAGERTPRRYPDGGRRRRSAGVPDRRSAACPGREGLRHAR
jgi:hypothetical protein